MNDRLGKFFLHNLRTRCLRFPQTFQKGLTLEMFPEFKRPVRHRLFF
jgi:hypothetical protein